MTATNEQELRALLEPWLGAEGLELDDLEFVGAGRSRSLRVTIDGDELDLDRISDVSQGLSRILDSDADIEGSYQLEVTSPGLERKLRVPAHFAKSVGRETKVKIRRDEVTTSITGVIESATDESFVIATDGGTESIAYSDLVSAKTLFRWEKNPKPGKKENRR